MAKRQELELYQGIQIVHGPDYGGYDVSKADIHTFSEGMALFSVDKATLRCYKNAAKLAKKLGCDVIGEAGFSSWDHGLVKIVRKDFCFWKDRSKSS